MADPAPFTLRWGILATGGIASTFAKDLLADPVARGQHEVRHQIVAAASSTSKERAAAFLEDVGANSERNPGADKKKPVAYGSYAALVTDPDVDIVYVATPHSHHFQNAMLALVVGNKHVLCEKALTVTAAQARRLVETARARSLFFMEAVWTRYFPLSVKIRSAVQAGAIGTVYRVVADNSINLNAPGDPTLVDFPDSSRMVNPALAGGALLDLGIYSLTWLFQILYHLQPAGAGAGGKKEKPKVVAAAVPYSRTGVDESTAVVLTFPGQHTQGIATTSMRVSSGVSLDEAQGPAILIQGSGGEIQVTGPAYKPLKFRMVVRGKTEGAGGAVEANTVFDYPIPEDHRPGVAWRGHGMFWEADEAARCLRDGKRESETLPLDESVVIMETMEEALRQCGITYPELITTDVFDANSPLNTGKN